MKRLITIIALLCAPLLALAQLSTTQIATLKAACLADAACTTLHNAPSPDDVAIAAWFNADTITYIVWRPSVTREEIMRDAGFDWARVDNLTVGKARIWDWMFIFGSIDPSKVNIRAGIDAAWAGTAADLAVRAAVYVVCKRSATRAEKALASGGGTSASPSVMSWSGAITYADASLIRS